MFNLNNQRAKLSSVNPRAELHGEDPKTAVDIKFVVVMENTVLDSFDKHLRPALFEFAHDDYEEDLADQGTDRGDDYRPVLRFPSLGKFPWDYKGAGYRLIIAQGFSGDEDLILIKTEIDKFKLQLKQGGSCEVEFRVIAHPNQADMGALCELIQHDVDITLEPPSAEDRAQMELDDAEQEQAA